MERFWSKVEPEPMSGCWLWTGAIKSTGYGNFALAARRGERSFAAAHRVAYELIVGPIPEGLELDHLCRNPACVNPEHLEPVTHLENVRRGSGPSAVANRAGTCVAGLHRMEGWNVLLQSTGDRRCRACHRDYMREWKRRKKAS